MIHAIFLIQVGMNLLILLIINLTKGIVVILDNILEVIYKIKGYDKEQIEIVVNMI